MISRRDAVRAVAGLGTLAGIGALARYAFLPPPAGARLDEERMNDLATKVFEAVPETARARTCLAFDHPLRQYYNRGLPVGGLNVNAASLGWAARRALTDLIDLNLSPAGRTRVPQQDAMSLTGVNFKRLLFFGDPRRGPYQALVSGVHLNLRLGGRCPENVAFGGPQIYGDQRGDGEIGLPGNAYRYQLAGAHRLWGALSAAERTAVRVARAPAQTNIGLQGPAGRFDGLPVAELALPKRRLVRATIANMLDTYADGSYAWDCLERNGGVEALHFADYDSDFQGGRRAGDAPSQVFRLEGPAAVLHFRGEPHVHAFIHVAQAADQQVSLGEPLGKNPVMLEGERLQAVFETAMREQAHAEVAFYPEAGMVGRLRAGLIKTGDVWVAESWVDDLVVAELRGADLQPGIIAAMRARGVEPQAGKRYRFATTGNVLRDGRLGRLDAGANPQSLGLLRDAISAYLRTAVFLMRG
ncbi:MAG: hypothetical protein WDM77_10325 [Steroidobacteraceae bacterium]